MQIFLYLDRFTPFPLPAHTFLFLFLSFLFLVCHVWRYEWAGGKKGTVGSSMEASGKVFQAQCGLNNVQALFEKRWIENLLCCNTRSISVRHCIVPEKGWKLATYVSCFHHCRSELEYINTYDYTFDLDWMPIVPFPTEAKSQVLVGVGGFFCPLWNGYDL